MQGGGQKYDAMQDVAHNMHMADNMDGKGKICDLQQEIKVCTSAFFILTALITTALKD